MTLKRAVLATALLAAFAAGIYWEVWWLMFGGLLGVIAVLLFADRGDRSGGPRNTHLPTWTRER